MHSWNRPVARVLQTLRLHSIKGKILAGAVLATLIPSLTMGWLSWVQIKESLTEKITEELDNVTAHAAREIDLWLKERFYDVRVFSSSYEVTENLEKLRAPRGAAESARALRRLSDYLTSVRGKFTDYDELLVLDPTGRVAATTAGRPGAIHLPPDWPGLAQKDKGILGPLYRDEAGAQPVMMIAVPIRAASGRLLGVLAAKLNLQTIHAVLRRFAVGTTGHVYVVLPDGTRVISSRRTLSAAGQTRPAAGAGAPGRPTSDGATLVYRDDEGQKVVGTLRRVPQLNWIVVAEIAEEEAYARVLRLRTLTVLIVSGLLLGMGLTAYLLGLTIVRPLDRLTQGAAKVAGGDLQVDLPVSGGGEVGYLTEVFNDMVARLRHGRDELARASVTDSLTGLYNRKHLMETLTGELARGRRYQHRCSVLMIDIDRFKQYNDGFGHLAGDELLTRLARLFRESIRASDYAARYGGEEFLIMLPETAVDGAMEFAERIRARVAAEPFGDAGQQVTVSIGVAGSREHGDTPEALIASADAALYQAKRRGRNRVVRAVKRDEKARQRA